MKFFKRMLLLLFVFLLFLVACSDEDKKDNSNKDDTDVTQNDDTPKEDSPTEEPPAEEPEDEAEDKQGNSNNEARGLIAKMREALNKVNSQSNHTIMSMEATGSTMSSLEFDFVTDSIFATGEEHSKGTMSSTANSNSFSMEMETYITNEGSYTFNSMFGGWTTSDAAASINTTSPNLIIDYLSTFADSFSVNERDGKLVITASGELEDYEFLLNSIAIEGTSASDNPDDFQYTINDLEYIVNPETFLIEKIYYDFEMSATDTNAGFQTMKVKLESKIEGYNTIDDIVVPQEIIDSASSTPDFPLPSE